jgi:Protein tyrosine and serine/threonine kinase
VCDLNFTDTCGKQFPNPLFHFDFSDIEAVDTTDATRATTGVSTGTTGATTSDPTTSGTPGSTGLSGAGSTGIGSTGTPGAGSTGIGSTGAPATTAAPNGAAGADAPTSATTAAADASGAVIGGVIAGVVVLICLLVGVFAVIYRRRRHQATAFSSSSDAESLATQENSDSGDSKDSNSESESSPNNAVPDLDLDQWEIDYAAIEKGKELARGNFGVVFKGLFRSNECVVKELILPEDAQEDEIAKVKREMLEEAALMARVKPHGSVATFYGVCTNPATPQCLVTELIEGGNLCDFLERRPDISVRDGLSLARDLASGLEHLASFNIMHCDGQFGFERRAFFYLLSSLGTNFSNTVAARNCLVLPHASPLRLKLCDFGLAKVCGAGDCIIIDCCHLNAHLPSFSKGCSQGL